MNTKSLLYGWLMICLIIAVPVWSAEEDETETSIEATAAVWGNHFEETSSKAEEYGDLPEGFLINAFKAEMNMKGGRYLEIRGKNVGLNSGQYGFDYGVDGKYDLYLDYTKIPHLFSRSGETIWTETQPGVWTLSDRLQGAIEAINPFPPVSTDPNYADALKEQRFFVSDLLQEAHSQSLGLQRNRTTAGFQYAPNTNWKYDVQYFLENRDGTRPFGTSFGFSWATELPERIDYDTQTVHAGVEYGKNGKSFTAAYDLNLFNNELNAMRWDNPYRLKPRTYDGAYSTGDGTDVAQMQLPVDNVSNTFSAAAAANLGKGRITGSFAYSIWTDDVDLLPFTVNKAVIAEDVENELQLPADTFSGKQKNLNLNVRYTTPVGSKGDFTAGYRLYDAKNDNDELFIGHYVRFDQVKEPLNRLNCGPDISGEACPTPLFAFRTNTLEANFGLRVTDSLKWNAGYSFNRWDREERDTEQTDTNTFKTGLDATASDWLTLRFSYAYAQRRSDEFHADADVYLVIPLRRYDVADVNQNLVRVIADFLPSESTTLGVTASVSNNDFTNSDYGVLKWNNYSIGADFSYAFKEKNNVNLWYEHAMTDRDQRGRQSGSTPATSTSADWTVTLKDQFDTVGAGYSSAFREGKTNWDINVSYAFADGNADIDAGPVLRPTGAIDHTELDDTDLFAVRTGISCKIFKRARVGAFYWFEKYLIDDFAEDEIKTDLIFTPATGVPPPGIVSGAITLNAIQPGYEFHAGWIGFIYNW